MKKLLALFVASLLLVSCGGRVPSPQTSHNVLQKHFKKYGKKYKESDFGRQAVERVEIEEIRELQRNMAEVAANVHLAGGFAYRVRVTLQKKTFGWRALAWENLGAP